MNSKTELLAAASALDVAANEIREWEYSAVFCQRLYERAAELRTQAAALADQPEPVAWRYRRTFGDKAWCLIDSPGSMDGLSAREGAVAQPLYPSPSAEGREWRTMEGAPKDAVVLLLTPTRWNKRCEMLPCAGYWFGAGWVNFNADEAVQRVEPTHWQPLPRPPIAEGAK